MIRHPRNAYECVRVVQLIPTCGRLPTYCHVYLKYKFSAIKTANTNTLAFNVCVCVLSSEECTVDPCCTADYEHVFPQHKLDKHCFHLQCVYLITWLLKISPDTHGITMVCCTKILPSLIYQHLAIINLPSCWFLNPAYR